MLPTCLRRAARARGGDVADARGDGAHPVLGDGLCALWCGVMSYKHDDDCPCHEPSVNGDESTVWAIFSSGA